MEDESFAEIVEKLSQASHKGRWLFCI